MELEWEMWLEKALLCIYFLFKFNPEANAKQDLSQLKAIMNIFFLLFDCEYESWMDKNFIFLLKNEKQTPECGGRIKF